MLDYKGTGMSVMEMSHRSKAFDEIIQEAEKDLRDLMHIPDNYKVLFLSGRSISAVCHDPDEPDEKQGCRLYRNRSVGKESMRRKHRSTEKQTKSPLQRRQDILLYPGLFRSSDQRRCRLCIHL